jgi:prepilin-type N-terminal cleavage/methylation domain-containing protein
MKRDLRAGRGGFTIIEVMIVLAIAGLILLILFLAVPAAKRSERNLERKNDAAMVTSHMAEYILDHGQKFPPDCDGAGVLPLCNAADDGTTGNSEFLSGEALHFFDIKDVAVTKFTSEPLTDITTLSPLPKAYSWLILRNYYMCQDSATAVPTSISTSFVSMYYLETGSGYQFHCQQS